MEKSILIPTDFSVESLNTLKVALSEDDHTQMHIILMCGEYLNDSITDLLFYSPERSLTKLLTPEFNEAISILKNRFEKKILSLKVELFHGATSQALRNFMHARNVQQVFIPRNYELRYNRNLFDIVPYLKDTHAHIFETQWESNISNSKGDHLNALFN
jgi:hypothetical protein